MVSKDRIEEEELTKQDVLDREVVEPQQQVEIPPEWEEHPEEAPGDNVHLEDDELVWERDRFEARLRSYETTHWKAAIDVPDRIGKAYPREIDVKSKPVPEHGFVESAEIEDYALARATLVIAENFMPVYEVNKFIDHLIESAEAAEEFQEELEEKLSVAGENES